MEYNLPRNQAYWPSQLKSQRGLQKDLSSGLNQLWRACLTALTASDSPRVWQTKGATGQPLWNAYNPQSGRTIHNVPEADLRVWLEERYYQAN
ncbi:MAG: hypothetical protein WA885_25470 [Phormidesmis sp.]